MTAYIKKIMELSQAQKEISAPMQELVEKYKKFDFDAFVKVRYLKWKYYILDNKHYAKEVIVKFNKTGLLEVRGEKYKSAYYPDENAVLQEWLERKRISFVYEEELGSVFYGRDILNHILATLVNGITKIRATHKNKEQSCGD